MSTSAMETQLTSGSVEALDRLIAGEKLEREINRSVVRWTEGGDSLHHLTFNNLEKCGALKAVRARKGYEMFAISTEGRKLRKEYE